MNKTAFAAALAAAGAACTARAAETNAPAVAELPTVVVEASRTGVTADRIPAPVRVIDRGEIAASGARDLAELVERRTTSLNVTRTGAGNPALSQIAMRGWGESGFGRVLVMVDGRRLNYADMSAPLLSQIDLSTVERVEILHGPQSVLHGDAASAGAVNIVTVPASGGDGGVHGRIEARAGSWDTYGASASVRGTEEASGVRYWAGGGWEHSEGFRGNNGWQIWNVLGGVRRDWGNGSFARVDAFWNDSGYGLPGYLAEDEWKHHRSHTDTPADRYRRSTAGVNGLAEFVVNEDNRLRLDASFSGSRMRTRSLYTGSYTDYDPANYYAPAQVVYSDMFRQRYELYSWEVTPQWICDADVFGLGSEFVAGASFRHDRLNGRSGDESAYYPDFWGLTGRTGSKYDYRRTSAALFAQETLELDETVSLQFGGRWQRTWGENTALVDRRRNDSMFAADAAVLLRPAEGMKGFLRVSRYFRSPFLDENPYRDYRAQGLLKPETGWMADAGLEWSFAEDFSVFGDVFYSKTKHEILYDKFVWGTNVNAPCDVVRAGFTAGAAWEREKVAGLSAAWTCTESEFDGGAYDGKDVPMSPGTTLAVSGRVWLLDDLFAFGGWRWVSTRRAYSDFANEGSRLSSFGVLHVGARYEPRTGPLAGLRLGVTVDNLLDRRYADCAVRSASGYEVYYPAAGRSVTFTVGWEF